MVSAACGGPFEIDTESVGVAASAVEQGNALNPNALNPNALNPNALDPNALALSALSPNVLSPDALSAIQAPDEGGSLSRELLRYAVSCAFDATQSFTFSWTDALGAVHAETYRGLIGLATSWSQQPLSTLGQQWVSACLAARANWYGAPVAISSRAQHPALNKAETAELSLYPNEEGAFWGNLFADPPRLYACDHGPNNDHSRDLLRECAAGHVVEPWSIEECGIIDIVGRCDLVCEPLHPNGVYHPSCDDTPGDEQPASSKVITVFLP
jgi:hypothetical protein